MYHSIHLHAFLMQILYLPPNSPKLKQKEMNHLINRQQSGLKITRGCPFKVLGAQLSPEGQEEVDGEGVVQKISPWGYLVYRNTTNFNMINLIGIQSTST
jgi:hypothetical protein